MNINTDNWIDEELASLQQSIELPGETASTEPGAAPLPRRRPAGRARSGRHTCVAERIVRCVRRELRAHGADIATFVTAVLCAVAVGFLVAQLT
jgi:hypothetical protein